MPFSLVSRYRQPDSCGDPSWGGVHIFQAIPPSPLPSEIQRLPLRHRNTQATLSGPD
ncbi:hypothetical protein EMPG_13366 [Blastomyces silverae]|uniref:Uncharacterized protein n=1 Tax=Blastomyces silverae TaxID=2060906 RepID=A0A0H1BIP5_9EURO|nr:hypothetical protein EMPG_13366 [Blastomyces silverae]